MSILVAMLMMAVPQEDLMANAAKRLAIRDEQPAQRRSPFRINASEAGASNAKDRAFADDGQRCQVVGARMCTKRPRALLSAPLSE